MLSGFKSNYMNNKAFNLEHQYQLYLARVGLSEARMNPIQRKETRQAFMGACGQMFSLFVNELADLSEKDACTTFEDMEKQVKIKFTLKSLFFFRFQKIIYFHWI